ncbi:unnamed protein product [Prunus armeniaca]
MHFLSSLLEAASHRLVLTTIIGSLTPRMFLPLSILGGTVGVCFGGLPTTIFCWLLVSPWWLPACYGGATGDCRIVRHMSVNGVRVS